MLSRVEIGEKEGFEKHLGRITLGIRNFKRKREIARDSKRSGWNFNQLVHVGSHSRQIA